MIDPHRKLKILGDALEKIATDLDNTTRASRLVAIEALTLASMMPVPENARLITEDESSRLLVLLDALFETGGEREGLALRVAEQLGIDLSKSALFNLDHCFETQKPIRVLFRGKIFEAMVAASALAGTSDGVTKAKITLIAIDPVAEKSPVPPEVEAPIEIAQSGTAVLMARAHVDLAAGQRVGFEMPYDQNNSLPREVVWGFAMEDMRTGQIGRVQVDLVGGMTIDRASYILRLLGGDQPAGQLLGADHA